MKIPDANLFIYAYDSRSRRHKAAREWVEQTLSASETVGFAWQMMLAFIRMSTRPAVVEAPLKVDEAIDRVERWLAQPCAAVIEPTHRHSAVLRDLLAPLGTAGNLTSDAHLAALAIEHGGTVYSCDNDFSRFRGVRFIDPLDG